MLGDMAAKRSNHGAHHDARAEAIARLRGAISDEVLRELERANYADAPEMGVREWLREARLIARERDRDRRQR